MALAIRGQEVVLAISVAGIKQAGTFARVNNFTITPRTDLVDQEYLGHKLDLNDVMHHGYDFSFEVDNEDSRALDFMVNLATNEEFGINPQQVVITVTHSFRDGGEASQHVMQGVVMKVSSHDFGGRKDFVTTSFEGKCQKIIATNDRGDLLIKLSAKIAVNI